MRPSEKVDHLFRTGRIARAAQQWNLESMASVMGVDQQEIVRMYGKPPLEREPDSIVYLLGHSIRPEDGEPVKIGYTRKIRQRLEALQAGSIKKLWLLAFLYGGRELEREIHNSLVHVCIREDWFEMCADVRNVFGEHLEIQRDGAA